jgi:hypothetical protein
VSSDEILPLRESDAGWQVQLREPRHWLTVETRQEACRIAGALPLAYTILHECEPTVGTLRELLECQQVLSRYTEDQAMPSLETLDKAISKARTLVQRDPSDSGR